MRDWNALAQLLSNLANLLIECSISLVETRRRRLISLSEAPRMLIGALLAKVGVSGRTMADLDASVGVFFIRIVSPVWYIIIVIVVDDNGLTNDLLKLVVVILLIFTAPLDQFCQAGWLDHDSGILPLEGTQQAVIVGIDVTDSSYHCQLHPAWKIERSVSTNAIAALFPSMPENLLQIFFRYFWEEFFDRSSDLVVGLATRHVIQYDAMLGQSVGDPALLLLLLYICLLDESALEESVSKFFASLVNHFIAKMIANAMNVMRYFCGVHCVCAYGLGLEFKISGVSTRSSVNRAQSGQQAADGLSMNGTYVNNIDCHVPLSREFFASFSKFACANR